MIRKLLAVAAIIGVFAVAILVREVLLLAFFALLLALVMSYPVRWLSRFMPRSVALALVLSGALCIAGGIGVMLAPAIRDQLRSVAHRLPHAFDDLQLWLKRLRNHALLPGLNKGGSIGDRLMSQLQAAVAKLIPAARGLIMLVFTAFAVVVLAAFLTLRPDTYRRGARALVPRRFEADFDELYRRLSRALHHWLGGVLAAMCLMGILTALGLFAAGIEQWALLGLLTFLATFVPYLGAICSAVPGLLFALAQSPHSFAWACVVYLGVHLMEGQLVEPIVMKRAVSIPPAVLLVGEASLGLIFGILGVLVAAPLLVCIMTSIQYLYVERYLGKRLDEAGVPRRAA